MDIKDINNNAAAMFLNLRNGLAGASESVPGTGFASLLTQTSSVMDIVPAGADKPLPDQKPAAAAGDDKTSAADIRPETDRAPAARKEKKTVAKPEKSAASKTKDIRGKDEAPAAVVEAAPEQVKTPAEKTGPVAGVVDETAPAAAKETAPDSRSWVISIIEQNGVSTGAMEGAFAAEGIVGIMSNGTIALADSALSLETLAAMPEVKVMQTDGAVVTMSGAELAAQIQGTDGAAGLRQISFLEAVKETEIPSELVKEAARLFNETTAVAPETSPARAYADAALGAQAAALDKKAEPRHKLEIEVDVREEKISRVVDNSLIKDKVTLADAVKAAEAFTEEEAPDSFLPAGQNTAKPAASPANSAAVANASAPVKPVVEMAAAAVAAAPAAETAETAAAVTAARVSSVTEINSSALARAGSTGSEFVNAARAEAKAQTADTSLRDVYKGMSKEVIDQVKVNITKSAVKGVDKIDVSLKPEELGHIEIKMQIAKDGKLHAHIIASRPETMEILQKEVQNLEKAFNDAGFSTDADSLSFSYNEGNQAGAQSDRNSDLRNFIGNVFANEAGDNAAGNDNLYYWDPAKGLNIRV